MGNRKKIIIILLAVLAILAITAVGYYIYSSNQKSQEEKEELQKENEELKEKAEKSSTDTTSETTKTTTPCASTLTDADKLVIQTWKTFTNSKYKYSFKYPESLVIKENKDDSVIFLDESDQSTLQFESGVTGGSTDGLKKTYEKEIEIACEKATVKYYSAIAATPGNDRYILAEFSKNDIPHILTTAYKFIGASLSSSYGQQYDIILKTIEFK
jgi:type II secretory pathway pseudopilin PulG